MLRRYTGSRVGHSSFYILLSGSAGPITQARAGMMVMWDLYNQQFVSIHFAGVAADLSVGISGSAIAGFSFARVDEVGGAFIGQLTQRTASAYLPAGLAPLAIGGTLTYSTYRTPNPRAPTGWYASAGLSVSLPPPFTAVGTGATLSWNALGISGFSFALSAGVRLHLPLLFDAGVSRVWYQPWNASTRAMRAFDERIGVPVSVGTYRNPIAHAGSEYLRFEGHSSKSTAKAMAKSIIAVTGPVGVPASLIGLAIGVLKDMHLESEDACL